METAGIEPASAVASNVPPWPGGHGGTISGAVPQERVEAQVASTAHPTTRLPTFHNVPSLAETRANVATAIPR
jgi:hypothetical protein